MSTIRNFAAILCIVTLVAGCDDGNPVLASASGAARTSAAAVVSPEQDALNEIARAVALALQDQGLRQRIKNDMRGSPYHEHKLDVRTYLNGESGGILLAKMAKATGRSREDLLATLDRVRPLEMYFPVRAHREGWTGGDDLQVLGHLNASGDPTMAYALTGTSVPVAGDVAPTTPTLAIVQRETDFSEPLDPSRNRNVRDKGGQSIGTYLQAISDCTFESSMTIQSVSSKHDSRLACIGGGGTIGGGTIGGGTTGGTSTPTPRFRTSQGFGLREVMTEYKQPRGLDGWFQGDPELYVEVTSHAGAPGDPFRPYFTSKVRFGAGQDDSDGWHSAGSPHLISWNAEYGNYIHLKFYEDDGASLIDFTITFQGKTYGIRIPAEREDLGAWTYSFNDQSLLYGIDGHGAGMFGANNGELIFITDYRAF